VYKNLALSTQEVVELISKGETLQVEFKGERQRPTSWSDIHEVVVCLANAEGGVLILGVEDDGSITGCQKRNSKPLDPVILQANIFNNTVPSINTRTSSHALIGGLVIAIEVDKMPAVCATTDGKCLRRVATIDGPSCQPYYPYQHQSRRIELGLEDQTAMPIQGSSLADLDPLEIERLRRTIERLGGDRQLLELSDQDVLKALRLVESKGKSLLPTLAGLLLVGSEEGIRRYIPTHQVAFQVLDKSNNVIVNRWFQAPLLTHYHRLNRY
jgi:ATP-dependent DNA helicase RecG